MKKLLIAIAALFLATSASAKDGFSKQGFMASKACIEKGIFADCALESYACGSEGCFRNMEVGTKAPKVKLVLFVHDDGKYYNLDTSKIHMSEMDEGFARNMVTITGEYDKRANKIVVREFKAPPPPKKSFFKGCL